MSRRRGRGTAPRCRVEGCGRPLSSGGLCALHALTRLYRTEAVKGVGLVAARVRSRPRVVLLPAGDDDRPAPRRP